MTLLVGSLVSLLVVVFGHFIDDLGRVVHDRARAQTAADAAALAAIAESGFYGSGAPEPAARRYAHMNGARLSECLCRPGATSVQVEVEIGDVRAEARAAVDPQRFAPAQQATALAGLDPRLAVAVDALLDATGGRVHLVSGYRSPQQQAMLWNRALARYGSSEAADDWVAPPGRSMHEAGLAVDLGGDLDLAAAQVEALRLPLYRPLAHEPWHFELVGTG